MTDGVREALEKYGSHLSDCGVFARHARRCTCGLETALALPAERPAGDDPIEPDELETLIGDRSAARDADAILREFVVTRRGVAQAALDPCPYAEDGTECLLEAHSIGPCLCVNPVAKASAVPSTEGK